jgi:5'-nucleotidase
MANEFSGQRPQRPYILVTNDDGIEAIGLWHLAEALLPFADVMISAPAYNQSGTGTAISLHSDLQTERVQSRLTGVDAFQTNGTPADAVGIGLRQHAKPRRVQMIVAGVNPGANMGRDAIHSGTVGAAMQGHHRGMPSVAVSLASTDEKHLPDAATIGAHVTASLWTSGLAQFLNVNVPDLPLAELSQIQVSRMAQASTERLVEEKDERGVILRRLEYREDPRVRQGTDAWAVRNGIVSITPIHTDLTAHHQMDEAAALFGEDFLQRGID